MRFISASIVLFVLLLSVSTARDQGASDQLAADAMLLFNNGDYPAAKEKMSAAAAAGSAQAQTRLAEMFESGLGVARDYISAHAWYNVAAAAGNSLARAKRDSLESRMTKEQISAAQEQARSLMQPVASAPGTSEAESITVAYTFGLFSGEPFDRLTFTAYRANATARQMVQDILSYNSIPGRSFRVVETPQVPNAAAAIRESERIIFYNPTFMSQVERSSRTSWEAYSIMAHEIGHHLAGHTIKPGGSRPQFELEADYFSGGTLARMGAALDETTAAMKKLGSPSGSTTHPRRDDRVAAITEGWNDARQKIGSQRGADQREEPRERDPAERAPRDREQPRTRSRPEQPAGDSRMIATVCATPFGACRLVAPVYGGNPCVCFGPGGAARGIAQ